ncbi:hypothetical protein MDA_GLEAN10005834 [Myotis davidii]|uniref:Uncharacterized protein n=1 Tax=Myotis davidii TaxID=225400 RepID=L5LR94_MYODS|nr:hypothetical protein MDA_GLEAN10005834 [Myotis davidii]
MLVRGSLIPLQGTRRGSGKEKPGEEKKRPRERSGPRRNHESPPGESLPGCHIAIGQTEAGKAGLLDLCQSRYRRG